MKAILIAFGLLGATASYAQQYPTSNTHCQLSVEEVLLQQSFDIDDPVSEDARYIFEEMYEELNLIYTTTSGSANLSTYIDAFEETITRAEDLNLNLSMFEQDIIHVENLNP
jgi:hypothetical protein